MQGNSPCQVQPFFFQGGDTGCLLVHGFGSTPDDIHPLGQFLRDKGYTVRGMVLPGHCTSPADMAKYTGQDWLKAVESETIALLRQCRRVWLVGFSMGGVLTSIAASRQPVTGLVSVSAPIWPRAKTVYFASMLKLIKRYVSMGARRQYQVPARRYNIVPVQNIVHLMRLIRMCRRILPTVSVPALVVQGDKDRTVKPASASYIYHTLGSAQKKLIWVPGGGHLLLLEPERLDIIARIEAFIRDHGR